METSKCQLKGGNLHASISQIGAKPWSLLSVELLARSLEKAIRKYTSGALLDFGSGDIPLYHVYSPFVREMICLDYVSNAYVDRILDLNYPTPYESGYFDTILCRDVIEHLYIVTQVWAEFERLLGDNGVPIIATPFLYWLYSRPNNYLRYSCHYLRHLCHTHRLEVMELHAYGGLFEVCIDFSAKNLVRTRLPLSRTTALSLQKTSLHFSRSYLGQKFLTFSSKRFPLGYLLVIKKSNHEYSTLC